MFGFSFILITFISVFPITRILFLDVITMILLFYVNQNAPMLL